MLQSKLRTTESQLEPITRAFVSPESVLKSSHQLLCSQGPSDLACLSLLSSPQSRHPARRLPAETEMYYFPRRPADELSQQVNHRIYAVVKYAGQQKGQQAP